MKIRFCLFVLLVASPDLRAQDMPLSQILIPGENWKKVDGTFKPIRYLTSYEPDVVNVWDDKMKLQGTINPKEMRVKTLTDYIPLQPDRFSWENGITLVLDRKNRAVRFERENPNELVNEVKLPFAEPGAMWITNDRATVLIGDAASNHIWSYRIDAKGLAAGEKYMTLRLKKGTIRAETSDIRTDPLGRIFAATIEGIQIFDPTGRLCGVLLNPSNERVTTICFGGEKGDLLFIACGKEIYYRRLSTPWAYFKTAEKK